jgi:cytochrome P450
MTTAPNQPLRRFPFIPGPLGGEPREYTERRATCPFGKVRLRDGREATLALRYADVAAALADERFSYQQEDVAALGRSASSSGNFTDSSALASTQTLLKRQRRIIAGALGPSRVAAKRPMIYEATGTFLDALVESGPDADLMSAFFTPYPVRVMCSVLGVPAEDYPLFRDWTNEFLSTVPVTAEQRNASMADFEKYISGLIAHKRLHPSDDLIGYLLGVRDEAAGITEQQITYWIMSTLALGTNALANVFGRITLMLLLNDGQMWDQVLDHGELDLAVLDELLRLVQQGNAALIKVASDDIELPSGTIRAGEAIALPLSSTGLDELAFPDPHALRLDRPGPRSLIFGGGMHFCLGQHLARTELHAGLSGLMARLPGLRLAADPKQLKFSRGELVHSLTALPVTW